MAAPSHILRPRPDDADDDASHAPGTLTLSVSLEGPFKAQKETLLRAFERAYFERLLERCHGNVARSAREAGLDRKHLYSLLHRHGLL